MSREYANIRKRYYDWMCRLVCDDDKLERYKKLLHRLHRTEFTYIIDMDANRAYDGIDLRYEFGYKMGIPDRYIRLYLDNNRPCSVLEMMVALAFRVEEHIMEDNDIGNRTGKWFWGMIENLGLITMDDINFDGNYFDKVIYEFLEREYEPNGEGGLFTLKYPREDLRKVDIWYQFMWFLTENFDFSI